MTHVLSCTINKLLFTKRAKKNWQDNQYYQNIVPTIVSNNFDPISCEIKLKKSDIATFNFI